MTEERMQVEVRAADCTLLGWVLVGMSLWRGLYVGRRVRFPQRLPFVLHSSAAPQYEAKTYDMEVQEYREGRNSWLAFNAGNLSLDDLRSIPSFIERKA